MKQTTETPDITSIEWKDLNPLEQHEMKRQEDLRPKYVMHKSKIGRLAVLSNKEDDNG